jgi:hypothetical protein
MVVIPDQVSHACTNQLSICVDITRGVCFLVLHFFVIVLPFLAEIQENKIVFCHNFLEDFEGNALITFLK